jgi:hypothetical protein
MHQESQYFWSDFPPGAEVHQRLLSAVMPTPEDYRHKKGQHRYRPFAAYSSRGNDRCFWLPGHLPALWRDMLANQEMVPGRIINGSAAGDSMGDHFPEMAIFRVAAPYLIYPRSGHITGSQRISHNPTTSVKNTTTNCSK